MAYAENFHGVGFPSGSYGGHLYLVCAVCNVTIWRHFHVSKPTFWRSLFTWYVYFSTSTPLLYASFHYELSALQVRLSVKNKLNATTQQFVTAKISGWALKQGTKTHSSMLQSNLQQQNEAALMSCQIRAVKHTKCAAGLADAYPGLQDRILLNYTRIENAHKLRKKTFDFLLFVEVQQTFCFSPLFLRAMFFNHV